MGRHLPGARRGPPIPAAEKGGIHDRGGHFAVEHPEFWLFPTQFHQAAEEFRPEAVALVAQAAATALPAGQVRFTLHAVVDEAVELADESRLERLSTLQMLSVATLRRRFHYRTPGLFVLPVRIYRLNQPIELPESPHFVGCRTWVDLGRELPTADLSPVLSEAVHQARLAEIRHALSA